MPHYVPYLIAVLLGYLFGCSNLALYISLYKGVDLRKSGSGNLGASNALILMGPKAGILVGIHDILKATIAVLIIRALFPDAHLAYVHAGMAAVLGHIFPFYLKFKGGKGFASYLGMTLALNWKIFLIIGIIIILVTLISDYIVVGTVSTMILVPILIAFTKASLFAFLLLALPSAVILWKHRENYPRILNGTEIGLRGAARGDHRKDR